MARWRGGAVAQRACEWEEVGKGDGKGVGEGEGETVAEGYVRASSLKANFHENSLHDVRVTPLARYPNYSMVAHVKQTQPVHPKPASRSVTASTLNDIAEP